MNMFLKFLLPLTLASLTACGGGGGSASPFGSGDSTDPVSSAASVDVIAGGVEVPSGGDQVTITAIVKGAGNVSLAGAPVSFSTSSGTLTSAAAVTDAAGVATAILTSGSNRSNRPLTVTVQSGSASGNVTLQVSGTTLSYTGASSVALGGTVPVSIKAVDSKGAVISGLPIAVTSSLNNGLSATSTTTDALGVATVDYTATSAGSDTLTFTGGGAPAVATVVQISGDNFQFVDAANAPIVVPPQISLPVSTARVLTVRYLVAGVPQANRTVSFTSTAGTATAVSGGVTDSLGRAQVSVISNTASPATVQATVAAAAPGGPTAQTSLPVVFVALAPARVVLQASPTALGPNIGGATSQQAQLLATVTDPNGNPVAGATVNFSRVSDPSGGNLSQPSTVTDPSGRASVQYIAGPSTTASNGVVFEARVAGVTTPGTANLTVNQSALFIALGTGNVIGNIDPQTYKKDWVVYVTDANGVAVPNITLTIKALPAEYGKGRLVFDEVWGYAPGVIFCPSEDNGGSVGSANAFNGILDPGEDANGNGRLEPGNVISVTADGLVGGASSGTVRTDTTGRATVSLIYAESYAPWVKLRLRAETIVSGTESSREAIFTVAGSAEDFSSATVPPAGVSSPFGTVLSCTNPN